MRTLSLFGILAGVAGVLLLPGLLIGPSLDAAVFVQVSREMADGAGLYTDVWDHKPPGVYLLLLAAWSLLPWVDAWAVAWGLTVLATAGAGTAVGSALRATGARPWVIFAVAVGAVVGMAQYLLSLGGGLTESLAVLPLAASLALAIAPSATPGARWPRAASIGGLVAFALLLSLQAAPGAAVVAALAMSRTPRAERIPAAGALLAGALLPAAAVGAWLAVSGGLGAAIDAVLGYAAAYRAVPTPGGRLFAPLAAWTVLALLFLIVPALSGAIGVRRLGEGRRDVALAALAWIALTIGLFVYQGRFYGHYAILLVPPLAMLAAPAVERMASAAASTAVRAVRLAPLAVAVLVSGLAGGAAGRMEADAVGAVNARASAVAGAVTSTTTDTDRIWVWGNVPQVYLRADRGQAAAFSYFYPLSTPGYATPGLVDDVLADLQARPPALVIDAGSPSPGAPGFLPLLMPRPVATDGRDLDLLDPLRAFVADGYELDGVVAGWPVYRLAGQGGAP